METILKKLTPLKTADGCLAYSMEDIKKALGDELFSAFKRWFAGQGGTIIEGKDCVWDEDFIRYLRLREEAVNKVKNL